MGCGASRVNFVTDFFQISPKVKIHYLAVRSTTSLGSLVMGFNETKYVSKKHLQFESTLSENALCQNSDLDLSGLTHSDSFFCFPIVLL